MGVGVMSASALARRRARPEIGNQVEAGTSSSLVSTPVGKGGFVGATSGETIAVVSRCPKTGRAQAQQVRASTAMPWKDMDVEVIIESTGAFNSLEGGSKHLDAGAKKVVLTAPGANCPTYVVGVNEGDYDPE